MDDLDALTALVKADLDKFHSSPQPTTNAERLAVLQSHLQASLEKHAASSSAPVVDALHMPTTGAAPDVNQIWPQVKKIVKSIAAATPEPAITTDAFTPCGSAVATGIVLISAGCAFGPAAGLVGFAAGVYGLTQNCHEGDTLVE